MIADARGVRSPDAIFSVVNCPAISKAIAINNDNIQPFCDLSRILCDLPFSLNFIIIIHLWMYKVNL